VFLLFDLFRGIYEKTDIFYCLVMVIAVVNVIFCQEVNKKDDSKAKKSPRNVTFNDPLDKSVLYLENNMPETPIQPNTEDPFK